LGLGLVASQSWVAAQGMKIMRFWIFSDGFYMGYFLVDFA